MKKETCPFCGHRWIRSSQDSNILCPNCGSKYNIKDLEAMKRREEEEFLEEEEHEDLDQ